MWMVEVVCAKWWLEVASHLARTDGPDPFLSVRIDDEFSEPRDHCTPSRMKPLERKARPYVCARIMLIYDVAISQDLHTFFFFFLLNLFSSMRLMLCVRGITKEFARSDAFVLANNVRTLQWTNVINARSLARTLIQIRYKCFSELERIAPVM